MKYIITEKQHRRLIENKEQEILHIPSLALFGGNWDSLQDYLNKKGNPLYTIDEDLDLSYSDIKSLGNLVSVSGFLDLRHCFYIESLGKLESVGGFLTLEYTSNIKSLGNLKSVGDNLYLGHSKIESLGDLESVGGDSNLRYSNVKSFGNLKSVGRYLTLNVTLSKKYSEEEIRDMITVGDEIYR